MTERPEERGSLAEIEKWHKPIWVHDHGANLCNIDRQHWPCDARILLNEATSLRRRLEETSWELADERAGLRRAEAEVKELREENAGLERTIGQDRDAWGRAESRIKQMEEALREAEAQLAELYDDPGPIIFKPEHRDWWRPRYDAALNIIRAALSPSDTEEVMTQTANEPST